MLLQSYRNQPFTCRTDELTGFYMMTILALRKDFIDKVHLVVHGFIISVYNS